MSIVSRRELFNLMSASVVASALPRLALAQAPGEFRIGALVPITGSGGPYGPGMLAAMELAVDEINAIGGAQGRKLRIFSEDEQSNADAAVLAAKKLIGVNRVDCILGTWVSGVTLAVLPLTNAAGIIEMNTSGAPEISDMNTKKLEFRFQGTNDRFGKIYAALARKNGWKRPATLVFNNSSGLATARGFDVAWKSQGGAVVDSVIYEPNRASYRTEIQRILSQSPDVVITQSYIADTTVFLRDYWQGNQKVNWIMPSYAAGPRLIEALGAEVCEGIYSVDTVADESGKAYEHFAARYESRTGQKAADNQYAAMTYDMVICLALGLEASSKDAAAEEISRNISKMSGPPGEKASTFEAGRELIRKGTKIDYDGASSKLDFDEKGDAQPSFVVKRIENGQLVRKEIIAL